MAFTFDPEKHEYRVDGRRVFSVTQYLQLAGFVDDEWFTEDGRTRGTAVHSAMHYLVQDDLNEVSVHPIIKPYIEAGKRFIVETGFKAKLVEYIVHDSIYGVIGTLDVTGTWKLTPGNILVDYKTGIIAPHVELQTAEYESCLPEPHRRFAVRLKANGTYQLSKEFKNRNDIQIFRALVATVNWKINNNLLVPEKVLAE